MRALPLFLIPTSLILTMVAHAQPCPSPLSTDNQKSVSLVGTLHQETHWGPPGFGESPKTDTKFIAWILMVDQPIQFRLGDEGSGPKDLSTRRIQLQSLSDMPMASIKKMVGKKVVASGPLYAATTGGDVTPVIVSSEMVRLAGDDALAECSVAK